MAWDSQYLWAARSDRTIDKIDVINKTVVETFTHNGMGTDYTRWRDLTWAGNYLWAVSNADGSDDSDTSKIYKIDPTDGSFLYSKTLTFDTNYRAQGLTWDGTNFHVLKENDLLYKVDSTNFNPLSSFSLQPDHQPIGPNQYIGLTNVAWDGAYFGPPRRMMGKYFNMIR